MFSKQNINVIKQEKKCRDIKSDKEEKWEVEDSVNSLILLSLVKERLKNKE